MYRRSLWFLRDRSSFPLAFLIKYRHYLTLLNMPVSYRILVRLEGSNCAKSLAPQVVIAAAALLLLLLSSLWCGVSFPAYPFSFLCLRSLWAMIARISNRACSRLRLRVSRIHATKSRRFAPSSAGVMLPPSPEVPDADPVLSAPWPQSAFAE